LALTIHLALGEIEIAPAGFTACVQLGVATQHEAVALARGFTAALGLDLTLRLCFDVDVAAGIDSRIARA
jgi:stage V sporulation protein SpoVS